MSKKKSELSNLVGFIDKGTEFNGELNFTGSFRIDGIFKGKISSDSSLLIGENGEVEADISIGSVYINGLVKGKIIAKDRVEVHNKGRIFGTIETSILVIEEGAYFEGNCIMNTKK
ncbi:MAG: polymer-forming cytoskeletal protein [Acidobacteriota bacterium]